MAGYKDGILWVLNTWLSSVTNCLYNPNLRLRATIDSSIASPAQCQELSLE